MTTPVRRSGGLAALAIALLVAACGTSTPTPPASPAPSQAAATPASPPPSASASAPTPVPSGSAAANACDLAEAESSPVAASPDTNDPNAAVYQAIEGQVSQLRGITATKPVERGVFDKAGLCTYIVSGFDKENPKAFIDGTEALYKALLLLPQDANLHDLIVELLTSQVVGLYDDKTKKMYVISETGDIGPAEKMTYAHEYTHALQDQRFPMKDVLAKAKDQGDRSLARLTLVEGDATLLMSLWAQQHLTPQELAQAATAADPATQAILERMPGILKETLLFPYTSGLQLSLGAFQQGGGYGGVDGLFANPPDTTEQVIHPEKLASREPAVAVSFPADLATRLGDGWKVAFEDTLGEFQLRVLLSDAAAAQGADAAAAGWGGDRVAWLTGPDGANAAVVDTRWDTNADASEFQAALGSYAAKLKAAGRSAAILTPAPDRVVLISAADDATLAKVANTLGLAG